MPKEISANLVRKTLEALHLRSDQKVGDEVVCDLLSRLGLPELASRYAQADVVKLYCQN